MDEVLKKLLKDKVLSEETMSAIKDRFTANLAEARVEIEKKVRAELAEQYETDKKAMHLALEQFLEQELSNHVVEIKEGVEAINKMKLDLAKKTSAVKESAKKYVKDRLAVIEQVVGRVLQKEIKELHESEVTNRKAYLKAINEKSAVLESERLKFRDKAAAVLENIINVHVQKSLDDLKEDIKAAKQQDFGRELYEAFMTTFRRQFFDSNKEFKAVVGELKEARAETLKVKKQATKALTEAKNRVQLAEAGRKKIEEAAVRRTKMEKLLSGLSGASREQMKTLLEASNTTDLEKTFKKFLPEVTTAKKSTQDRKTEKVTETALVLKTGNVLVEEKNDTNAKDEEEIQSIRRAAGIKK